MPQTWKVITNHRHYSGTASFPMAHIGDRYFLLERIDFLIVADVFSIYFIVRKLPNSTSAAICAELPSKTSFGHDKVSNVMLKSIITAISTPLSIVFNQSISTGKFPHKMKQAEVVLLYKGKDMDVVINYRPISLLITILKLLEKVVYRRMYSFLKKYDILFQS